MGFDCRANTGVGQVPAAQRVAQLFAIGGVALPRETAAGIAAVARLAESQKSVATPDTVVFQQPAMVDGPLSMDVF